MNMQGIIDQLSNLNREELEKVNLATTALLGAKAEEPKPISPVKCVKIPGFPSVYNNGGELRVIHDLLGRTRIEGNDWVAFCFHVLVFRYGYPNEDAISGDPAYTESLRPGIAVEILNSPWLKIQVPFLDGT